MSTKVKKLLKRTLSLFLSALLVSMIWMDGHVKAAVISQEISGCYLTAASALPSSGETEAADDGQEQEAASPADNGQAKGTASLADKAYSALDALKTTTDAESSNYYIGNGADAVRNIIESEITGNIQDAIGDWCLSAGNKIYTNGAGMLADAGKLTQKAHNMQQEIDALTAKLGTAGSKGSQKRLDRMLAAQGGKLSDASDLTAKGNLYKVGGKLLSAVSIGLDAYNIYGDAQSLGELQNEHASLRAVEGGLYIADMGLSAASILCAGAVLFGVTSATALAPVTAALGVIGTVVGIASSIIGSEGFANLMNNTDNATLRYFDNLVSDLFQNIKTALGIGCYKPNIYIYGADGQTVRVIMQTPGLIVKSIPEYETESGWEVTAESDGRLKTADGETYDFLFYESMTERTLFETEEGFLVTAQERTEQWSDILSAYGFTEQEIRDFVEFWDAKLEKEDYVMYPQYTESVDAAMPVEILPAPEHMTRMWFVFEAYDGQAYETPEITPFDRSGYTVVEWGGMIF